MSGDAVQARADTNQQVARIERILDVDGRVLYSAAPEQRVITSAEVGAMTADILHNVVMHGTGRRARNVVQLNGKPLGLGGKTGTTNDFRNAAFMGFVPAGGSTRLTIDGGFTLGVYVGYDDNRPMSRGRIRLAGSSGALPAWIGLARGLADQGLIEPPAWASAEGDWTMEWPDGLVEVAVSGVTGLPVDGGDSALAVLARKEATTAGVAHFEHRPRPVRVSPRTVDIERLLEKRRKVRREALGRQPSIWDGR